MAIGARRSSDHDGPRSRAAPAELICLACGIALPPPLAHCGSLRCDDCRSTAQPLDAGLLERQHDLSAGSELAG